MKRFLAILLVSLALCAACAGSVCAAGQTAFNPNAAQRCIFLTDTNPAMGFGHCAMVLVDDNGYGRLYSYQSNGMLAATLSPAQVRQFQKDGLIPKTIAISRFQFNKALDFEILPEEGRKMYVQAETKEFQPFFMYASFYHSIIPYRDNCLTVVRSIMSAGSSKYQFYYPFGAPALTFYSLKWRLQLRSIPFEIYYPGQDQA